MLLYVNTDAIVILYGLYYKKWSASRIQKNKDSTVFNRDFFKKSRAGHLIETVSKKVKKTV